jgi:phosphomethylpyrimidine synthase
MEHIGLPEAEDVRAGVIAYKIAAHAADIAKGIPNARKQDDAISEARANFDWDKQFELALDPEMARSMRQRSLKAQKQPEHKGGQFCTMCGPKLCSMRVSKEL